MNKTKYSIFPVTKYFYFEGMKRWKEPTDLNEIVGYCGPPDRCCIDCYLCFTPICFFLDLGTFFSLQCFKYDKEIDFKDKVEVLVSDV
jgi:hypothetical protein